MVRKSIALKTVALLLALISICFIFSACENKENGETIKHEISFCLDGEVYSKTKVNHGTTLAKPQNPDKDNYLFLYWCTDASLKNEYDFSKSVLMPFTLYAKFTLDGVSLTNKITTNTIKSVVKIINTSYNTGGFFGNVTSQTSGQGSGVIYKAENNWFYVLTNCHVAIVKQNFSHLNLEVYDYAGRKFSAEFISASADYDLALIKFKQATNENDKTDAIALSFSSADLSANDDVIALGTPKGQVNAISFGKVNTYKTIQLSETEAYYSNVKFNIIEHTAYINSGSSGGPLLNANLEIAGLNYAGVADCSVGFTIPTSKIKEYMASIS